MWLPFPARRYRGKFKHRCWKYENPLNLMMQRTQAGPMRAYDQPNSRYLSDSNHSSYKYPGFSPSYPRPLSSIINLHFRLWDIPIESSIQFNFHVQARRSYISAIKTLSSNALSLVGSQNMPQYSPIKISGCTVRVQGEEETSQVKTVPANPCKCSSHSTTHQAYG